jgi:hypothetical protein
MAGRGMTAAAKTQASATQLQSAHLLSVHFDAPTGTIYLTDYARNIVSGGQTYLGAGHLVGLDAVQETAEALVQSIQATFSGVDQVWIANILTEQFMDRRLMISRAFLNTTTEALIADPVLIFDGRMDSPSISEDPVAGTCTVAVVATNHWTDFQRRPGRHTSSAEQQIHYPGDPSFDLMNTLKDPVKWPNIPPWL